MLLKGDVNRIYDDEYRAVENAKKNAKRNNITNAEFYCGDAGKVFGDLRKKGCAPDIIVVDNECRVVMSVSDNSKLVEGMVIKNESIQNALNQNKYFEKGTMGGLYSEDHYISTKTIYGANSTDAIGAVIVSANTKDIDSFMQELSKILDDRRN